MVNNNLVMEKFNIKLVDQNKGFRFNVCTWYTYVCFGIQI
jgi:hypothetical protein